MVKIYLAVQVPKDDNFLQPSLDDAETVSNSKAVAAASMVRTHSVSGDLHGVQPDPVAADILRKEPEQESYIKLRITPTGIVLLSYKNWKLYYQKGQFLCRDSFCR